MTTQQKQELMSFLQRFCQDNIGNRLNEWLAESLLNRAARLLDELDRQAGGPAVGPTSAGKILNKEG